MKPAGTDPREIEARLWQGFDGKIGFDIGANCGQSADEMCRRFEKVFAFEPAEECFSYLMDVSRRHRSVVADTSDLSGTHYQWFPVAVSDNDEVADLIELPGKIDTGQLVSTDAQGMEYDPQSPDAEVRRVACRTVDSLIETWSIPVPDFLKIDVEGHELKVLYGAKKTLAVHRPDILLEFHSRDLHESCKELLHGFGYDVFTVRHPHYAPGSDLWFAHGWLRATQPVREAA